MRITLIGAGSHVFAPGLVTDLILEHRVPDVHLAVVDVDQAAADLLAAYARRLAADTGLVMTVSAHTNRAEALPGSDAVVVCAAVQGRKRAQMDVEVLRAHGLADQARECGGLGGLIYSCRSIALILDICSDMRRLCPNAWLLDVTNPMPRVVTAAVRHGGVRAMGFCNAAWGGATGYVAIGKALGRDHRELKIVTGGINHFAWAASVRDHAGTDLLPEITARIQAGATAFGDPRLVLRWIERYGSIPVSGANHQGEHLPSEPELSFGEDAFHGDGTERMVQIRDMQAIIAGTLNWRVQRPPTAWEHPLTAFMALSLGGDADIDMVNLPNDGHLPQLPSERVIEAPIQIRGGKMIPATPLVLPEATAAVCRAASDVIELVAHGAAVGDREALHAALRCDPAVTDVERAIPVLDLLLTIHADVLPAFKNASRPSTLSCQS